MLPTADVKDQLAAVPKKSPGELTESRRDLLSVDHSTPLACESHYTQSRSSSSAGSRGVAHGVRGSGRGLKHASQLQVHQEPGSPR